MRRRNIGHTPTAHGQRRRQMGGGVATAGHGLRRQPRRHRAHIIGREFLRHVGHAIGRLRAALAGLPGAQLAVEVIARQAQQARDGRRHARHGAAVARHTGRNAPRGIALLHQHAATLQRRCGRLRRRRWRVRHVLRGKVRRHLAQVVVGQVFDEVAHLRVAAPPIAKVEQLIGQIPRRFARDARKVPLWRGPALFAMARRAGQHTRRHRCSGHGRGRCGGRSGVRSGRCNGRRRGKRLRTGRRFCARRPARTHRPGTAQRGSQHSPSGPTNN